ncbi:dipeptidase [Luteimonas sp. XNQY3]|nr:membrane dipeptidase [Luteimonas sp. XNQY3]MCD9005709.1 dipeptidase [Luteimonas sp. XNQY3]
MNRRELLIAAGAAAVARCLGPVGAASASRARGNVPLPWPPYADMLVIDGCGGLGRWGGPPDRSLDALTLADARASGVDAVVLTTAPSGRSWFGEAGYQTVLGELAHWDRQLRLHPDRLIGILSADDLARARRERRFGLIYGFQDTSPLGEDLDRIDLYHRRGVRVIQLTHNRRNLVGDGCMEPGNAGLSNFGRQVVAGLNAHRVLVDLSHAGRRTAMEGVLASERPVVFSHTGCAALSDVPRCMPDDVLRAMADRGGVAAIVFWPYLRTLGQPTSEDLIRHIEHAIDVCGEDHVGLGTDATVSAVERTPEFEAQNRQWVEHMLEIGFFEAGNAPELYTFIPDLNHVRRLETLAALLSRRGHSEARIGKILGGNFARVMREVWG